MLTDYQDYNHRCVRDLAWVIASPPLLMATADEVLWPNGDWYLSAWRETRHWLTELDRHPAPLLDHCQTLCGSNKRLGRYFEALLAFWLSHDPRYELLHHDLQIHMDGRTIGAFDFIVRDHSTGMTLHIEAAIKFYLGTGDDAWPGPNRKDSLKRKYDHLVQKQSRLSLHPGVKQQLLAMDINIDRRMVILKGRLFYPTTTTQAPPVQAFTGHQQGQWWPQHGFLQYFENRPQTWIVLDKSSWLSTIKTADHIAPMAISQLKEHWHEQPLQWPRCLAATDTMGNETFRVFVVPDDWDEG